MHLSRTTASMLERERYLSRINNCHTVQRFSRNMRPTHSHPDTTQHIASDVKRTISAISLLEKGSHDMRVITVFYQKFRIFKIRYFNQPLILYNSKITTPQYIRAHMANIARRRSIDRTSSTQTLFCVIFKTTLNYVLFQPARKSAKT